MIVHVKRRRRTGLVVDLSLMKLRWMMRLRMKMNGKKVPRKLALLGMSLMNMGLLQGKLKGVDVEPVSGSKFDMQENESVSLFFYNGVCLSF